MQSNKSQEVESARRRLIRGTFAAPAVLALHSGSALAASSNLRCVQAQIANPVYPGYTPGMDTYVRVQLHTGLDALGVRHWYLSGSAITAAAKIINKKLIIDVARFQPPLTTGQWREVTLESAGTVKLGDLIPEPANIELNSYSKYLALRMTYTKSTTGNIVYVDIVGVVDGTQTGSAITGSCWSSLAPSIA